MGKSDSASAETPDKEKEEVKEKASDAKNKPEEQKEDVENLRKVIKLSDNADEGAKTDQPAKEETEEKEDNLDGIDDLVEEAEEDGSSAPASTREELEQKRAILQRIKDFDFQIKKNQQDINAVGEKITALSKDLDDLVSLYEIVSEQMNPFVGLSKVTKKRLESLENITNELDALKDKLSTIEAGGAIQTIQKEQTISSVETSFDMDLSDEEMDRIIELSFFEISPESAVQDPIDSAIDVYIENLKAGKLN